MAQLDEMLERLTRSRFEFVLVGAFAAIVHGASVMTRDVDVCAPFNVENLYRLREAIGDLHPWHRTTPQRLPLELNDSTIAELRNLYLGTDIGPLDVLGEIVAVGDYQTVLSNSVVVKFQFGDVRVMDIDALIATKSHLMRLQDKLVLPQLAAIKARRSVKSS
jgi:hypothetical protein